jgi:hypothetical protein
MQQHSKRICTYAKPVETDYLSEQRDRTAAMMAPKPPHKSSPTSERRAEIAALLRADNYRAALKIANAATIDKVLGDMYLGKL